MPVSTQEASLACSAFASRLTCVPVAMSTAHSFLCACGVSTRKNPLVLDRDADGFAVAQ